MKCCDIPIGKMRSLVSLQHRTKTTDGAGGWTNTWTQYAKVWAWIKPLSGSETLTSMQLENPVTHRIYIRYRSDMLESDRIVHRSRNFNIRSILDIEELKRYIEISAEENVAP